MGWDGMDDGVSDLANVRLADMGESLSQRCHVACRKQFHVV